MSTIEELEAKVKSLNPRELAEFREWFRRFEDAVWVRNIMEDRTTGKFTALIAAAREQMAKCKGP